MRIAQINSQTKKEYNQNFKAKLIMDEKLWIKITKALRDKKHSSDILKSLTNIDVFLPSKKIFINKKTINGKQFITVNCDLGKGEQFYKNEQSSNFIKFFIKMASDWAKKAAENGAMPRPNHKGDFLKSRRDIIGLPIRTKQSPEHKPKSKSKKFNDKIYVYGRGIPRKSIDTKKTPEFFGVYQSN